jgi:hypothetical protein
VEQRDRQGSTAPEHAPIPDDERYRRIVEHMPVVVYTHDGSRPPASGLRHRIDELHPRAEDPT